MSFLAPETWKLGLLAHRYARAQPFRHVVMDDVLDDQACAAITEALGDEDSRRLVSEIYEVMATGEPLQVAVLAALAASLESRPVLRAVGAITDNSELSRATMRGYAFGPGHYLLPHADSDEDARRVIAYALYVQCSTDLEGGELELYAVRRDERGNTVETEPAGRIVPRAGRLVLFEVSDDSLHAVREVVRGLRVSLSGWFYTERGRPKDARGGR